LKRQSPISGAEYDAWLIDISEATSSSSFVELNPIPRIPVMVDLVALTSFESGSILLYLAEKFGFLSSDPTTHRDAFVLANGQRTYLGGGFGPSTPMRPPKSEYAIDRLPWK
jgi:glutathione S-transferase